MDALEAVLNRRSIRKYSDRSIPKDKINTLLEAAMNAPSAKNEQTWCFVVLDEKQYLKKIAVSHPHADMLKQADKAILVCGDLKREKTENYWMINCSAATENILIAAHGLGIGSCWIGIYPRAERVNMIKEIVELPDHVVPFALVSLGYPDEKHRRVNRFDESRVHYNKW
ncbi:MAG: nitroreductase family protein [Candidatus Thermoplasmatota archaeon]